MTLTLSAIDPDLGFNEIQPQITNKKEISHLYICCLDLMTLLFKLVLDVLNMYL